MYSEYPDLSDRPAREMHCGYTVDCWPGLKVGIWSHFSDQYCIKSTRSP
jgi:hypothetical protein